MDWIITLLPVLAPALVWGVKALMPKIPKPLLAPLSMVLGAAVDLATYYAGAAAIPGAPPGLVGSLLGAVGLVLREAYTETKKALGPA